MTDKRAWSPEEAQDELVKLEGNKRQQYDEDLRAALLHPAASRVLARILWDTCRLDRSSYVPDANATAYNEGLRSVAIFYKGECMRVDPHAFLNMQAEHFSELVSHKQQQAVIEDKTRADE